MTGYEHVCDLVDLPQVGAVQAEVGGIIMSLVRTEGGMVHAIDDTCTHQNVSLSEGEVTGCELECWLHGSRFNLETGMPSGLPATIAVKVYPVRIEGDAVLVSPEPILQEN